MANKLNKMRWVMHLMLFCIELRISLTKAMFCTWTTFTTTSHLLSLNKNSYLCDTLENNQTENPKTVVAKKLC